MRQKIYSCRKFKDSASFSDASLSVQRTVRSILMNMKSVAKGAAAGAIVGITYYALSSATPMKKYSIKRNAGRTLKAAGSLIDDIKSVLM